MSDSSDMLGLINDRADSLYESRVHGLRNENQEKSIDLRGKMREI